MHPICALAIMLALAAGETAPQDVPTPDDRRPLSARRVAASFDFEELDNPEPVPKDWFRHHTTRENPLEGFPGYNHAEFDWSDAHAGKRSVLLPARTGSTALRLHSQAIPVFPDADYQVRAMVRTEGLENARAFIAARFLDKFGNPIEASEVRSRPIISPTWTNASVRLAGRFLDAEWLQVDLQLLQPRQFERVARPDDHVWRQDYNVAARFDDVVIDHMPRVEIIAGTPSGLFIGEPPRLTAIVRDLVGDALTAQLTLRDIDGSVVATHIAPVDATGEPIRWSPRAPRYGWYQATVDVLADGEPVGRSFTSLLWLPTLPIRTNPRATDLRRFGIIADRIRPDDLAIAANVISRAGPGFIHLSAWQADDTGATFPDRVALRKPIIDRLLQQGMDVTITFPELPDELVGLANQSQSPYQIVAMGERSWNPFIAPLLDRFGQRVRRWQIGRTGTDDASTDPLFEAAAERFNELLTRLVPSALVSYPWATDLQPPSPGSGARTLTLTYPAAFPPESFATYRAEALPTDEYPGEATFVLALPDARLVGRRARLIEIARRAIEAWAVIGDEATTAPARLAIDHPWLDAMGRERQFLPEPELGAWRIIAERLAGRRVLAEMPTPPGLRCFLIGSMDPQTGALTRGALVGWNEGLPATDAHIEHQIADEPLTRVDLFGNTDLLPVNPGRPTRISFGRTPTFIEGVDARIAKFIAGYRIEPTRIPPVRSEHLGAIVIENPWTTPISGRIKLKNPGTGSRAWQLSPAGAVEFTIPPKQTHRIPFSFSFGPAEEAGPKTLDAIVRVVTEQKLPPIRLTSTIELGLDDLEMIPDYVIIEAPEGNHVAVVATIINSGDRPRSLVLQARPPRNSNAASQRLTISNLGPGQTVRKRLVFQNAAPALLGQHILVRLEDPDALAYILKSVLVN